MKELVSCAYNMDTGCVELRYSDGRMQRAIFSVSYCGMPDLHNMGNHLLQQKKFSYYSGVLSSPIKNTATVPGPQ